MDERRLPVPRARGGAARGGPRARCAGSATSQLPPGAIIPAWVEREFSFFLDGDKVRGRFDRVDIMPRDPNEPVPVMADDDDPASGADVVEPTLDLSPERVVITDYKSSRRPRPGQGAPAGEGLAPAVDLRDGLRGDDRAAAGCRRAPLPRLGPRRDGAGRPASRSTRRATAIRTAAAGIRARDFTAKPDHLSCSCCAFREICPSSVAR